ncbi:MAG TPA: hopanoid biosynthesis-associated protein HpnK [Gammaproteobacteria bacterium]|nr:hopanoid biosynthesis-associated protein HpnK [Gammaproteobacteria bacterium]
MKTLIVTADDFGLSVPVNEAVEEAHRRGILTAASLMVTAPAAADAVERARRLSTLGVGLHLALVDGRPALPAEQLPDLVGRDGRFLRDPVRVGVKLFFLRPVQQQAEVEVRAQLERFLATGLPLDHVDGHHHFHQHPVIVDLLIKLAPEYGIKAVRVPSEPPLVSWRAQREGLLRRCRGWLFAANRLRTMRRRLRRAGILCNDHIFGLYDSGRMTSARIVRFLDHLPDGVTELYCHPATRRWPADADHLPDSYLCTEEFIALADPERRAQLESLGVRRVAFRGLTA